jgi:hypothetical protein
VPHDRGDGEVERVGGRYGRSWGLQTLATSGSPPRFVPGLRSPEKLWACASTRIVPSPTLPTVAGFPKSLQDDSPPPPAAPAAPIPTRVKHATMLAMTRIRIFFNDRPFSLQHAGRLRRKKSHGDGRASQLVLSVAEPLAGENEDARGGPGREFTRTRDATHAATARSVHRSADMSDASAIGRESIVSAP